MVRRGVVTERTDEAAKRRVGFDDPDFARLCLLAQDVLALLRGDWSGCVRILRGLLRSAPLLRSIVRLPGEALHLSDGPSGQRIRGYLPPGLVTARRRVAISTLTLPADFEEYRRGRSRQALRTNCSRAVRAGITVERVEDAERIRERITEVFAERDEPGPQSWHLRRAELHEGEFWFAVDATGHTLAFSEVIVDERAAMLNSMLRARRSGGSEARYLLMAEVFESLSRRGVRQVVVARAFWLTPGLVYFQRLLGFAPKNLRIVALSDRRERHRIRRSGRAPGMRAAP